MNTLLNFETLFDAAEQQTLSADDIQKYLDTLGVHSRLEQLHLMSGGFRYQNYHLTLAGQPYVLRLLSNLISARKEASLLACLEADLPVPRVLYQAEHAHNALLLLNLCPGIAPWRLPHDLPLDQWWHLGQNIGLHLSDIHRFNYPHAGELNADLQICQPWTDLSQSWLGYLEPLLAQQQVLSPHLTQRIWHWLVEIAPFFEPTQSCLVHADFNLKNLLVTPLAGYWQVSAILDWEFAHAGPGLIDIGNFMRFEERLPPALLAGFLVGYQNEHPLPVDWQNRARWLDAVALCSMLDSPGPKPLTWKTIVERLERYITLPSS